MSFISDFLSFNDVNRRSLVFLRDENCNKLLGSDFRISDSDLFNSFSILNAANPIGIDIHSEAATMPPTMPAADAK